MSQILEKKYTVTGRYDKSNKRQKIFGLCGNCGISGYAITCKIRTKTRSLDIPLGVKYCTVCKVLTLIDEKLKIVNKNGCELL